ncbi:peptidoglycan recognition protein family protein [Afifella marina]|uniref:N-acetylmuramoyl-L-alanine amidase n=1 Tax=Afifella marina DSM 2698 TaxID=1120955 RepID=A0A1G5N3C8_AFIMA|nr:N-acetylmuramoyl-L-alanine amidase [Afifella marina]MBK1622399.1 N-acetylmuramoyl-L-alanine amidase [Afifella marina DSM 2698]MBK1626887.1 N-acetylmuramoyl-L-alanine amidase [Afifella marina]MBK5919183.1 N-acetylmuramoyl-L-alanine amidase [Afifella marina]RAI21230.1 N-acetylmuramoyl-L-alanine amidase [Afifella marina DSM 2698]SCZ31873.1 N-acetylmuramoyl-L-alanine amidase [Afifella marina DSM 2698]
MSNSPLAEWRPSPNFNSRNGEPIDLLLLHYTGMESEDAALARLCDPEAQVSCHYLVRTDGTRLQLVDEKDRAWHAGRAAWSGARDINARSIGIEIANWGHAALEEGEPLPPFSPRQIDSVIALCLDILTRHKIPARRVLGHSDVAPERKLDPGELFPWHQLAKAGIGHFVSPKPASPEPVLALGAEGEHVADLQSLLALYGYGVTVSGVYDERTQTIVAAFQRHFRPERIDGIVDHSTLHTLHNLLAAIDEI